jgi:ribonuclease HI
MLRDSKRKGWPIRLMKAAGVRVLRWRKIRSAANPYDPSWEAYLEEPTLLKASFALTKNWNFGIATGGCAMSESTEVTVYTDGACVGNPGPGGYAAVLICGSKRKEFIGGRRLTTNNRMEVLAAIVALEALNWSCRVKVHSDSRYLVDAIAQGWARRWQEQGWKRRRKPVANADLWERLLLICEKHEVEFVWVAGHTGHPENERCDLLAEAAALDPDLPSDSGYEECLARQDIQASAQPNLFEE